MKITDGLRKDHELIMDALALLHEVSETLDEGVVVSGPDLAALLEFFAVFADGQHHAKEEETLFPAMVAAGLPPRGGPVMIMLAEHEEGRGYLRRLRGLTELSSPSVRATFVTLARQYRGLLEHHIAKENQVLFVMAERLLKGRDVPLDDALAIQEKALPAEATFDRWVARITALRSAFRAQRGALANAAAAPICP
jgi:hemerythrin-like domain-containing protein